MANEGLVNLVAWCRRERESLVMQREMLQSGKFRIFNVEEGKQVDTSAENIEQIRILFGVDSDGDQSANSYVPPSAAVNMANVVSVRINLLVRSGNDNVATQSQTYFYNGTNVVATDKRIRRAFGATIGLRNRTL